LPIGAIGISEKDIRLWVNVAMNPKYASAGLDRHSGPRPIAAASCMARSVRAEVGGQSSCMGTTRVSLETAFWPAPKGTGGFGPTRCRPVPQGRAGLPSGARLQISDLEGVKYFTGRRQERRIPSSGAVSGGYHVEKACSNGRPGREQHTNL
jgi:hypothetical protein